MMNEPQMFCEPDKIQMNFLIFYKIIVVKRILCYTLSMRKK